MNHLHILSLLIICCPSINAMTAQEKERAQKAEFDAMMELADELVADFEKEQREAARTAPQVPHPQELPAAASSLKSQDAATHPVAPITTAHKTHHAASSKQNVSAQAIKTADPKAPRNVSQSLVSKPAKSTFFSKKRVAAFLCSSAIIAIVLKKRADRKQHAHIQKA